MKSGGLGSSSSDKLFMVLFAPLGFQSDIEKIRKNGVQVHINIYIYINHINHINIYSLQFKLRAGKVAAAACA
jgi:hypothetical protein